MKYIFKYLIVLAFVFSGTNIIAQNDAMNFTISSNAVRTAGQDISVSSTITKTDNTLVWTQNNAGNIDVSNFSIISTDGNWDESTSLGSITYTMAIEGYQSELTLIGQESGITATLTFKITETEGEDYFFNIDTISYQ
jgi:hypothetical protein